MSKSSYSPLSALFSVLAMGSLAPAFAGELGPTSVQDLRQAPGAEGVGFGALVLPSTHELGQLSATLYDDADQSLSMLTGTLSLYIPIAAQREQFGGFSGSLRQLHPGTMGQTGLFGSVEGTWSMNGNGQGTLQAIAYQRNQAGNQQIVAVLTGQFDAVAITVSTIESSSRQSGPEVADQAANGIAVSSKPSSAKAYRFLRRVREHIQGEQQRDPQNFGMRVQAARDRYRLASFGARSAELDQHIAGARRMAQAQSSSVASRLPDITTETHLEAHIGISYKLLN